MSLFSYHAFNGVLCPRCACWRYWRGFFCKNGDPRWRRILGGARVRQVPALGHRRQAVPVPRCSRGRRGARGGGSQRDAVEWRAAWQGLVSHARWDFLWRVAGGAERCRCVTPLRAARLSPRTLYSSTPPLHTHTHTPNSQVHPSLAAAARMVARQAALALPRTSRRLRAKVELATFLQASPRAQRRASHSAWAMRLQSSALWTQRAYTGTRSGCHQRLRCTPLCWAASA